MNVLKHVIVYYLPFLDLSFVDRKPSLQYPRKTDTKQTGTQAFDGYAIDGTFNLKPSLNRNFNTYVIAYPIRDFENVF
jgi:hypothetical protein